MPHGPTSTQIQTGGIGGKPRGPRISRRRFVSVALPGLIGFPAVVRAQGVSADEWKGIVASARKEGSVVVYSSTVVSVSERLKADFEQAFPGIIMEFARNSGTAQLSKLAQERQTGADGADVAINTELLWFEERIKDRSILSPRGPSVDSWPPSYMIGGEVPVLALEPFVLTYNTNLIKTAIIGYADLLKAEYKGRFGVQDIVATSVLAWYDWLEKTYGPDFLANLAAQQPQIYFSGPTAVQSVAAGELPICAFTNLGSALPLVNQGAPIKIVLPNPSYGIRYAGGLLAWAKRPNAAQLFMEYVLSPRGQRVWNGKGETASPLPNIPGSLDANTVHPYDPAAYPPEVVTAYQEKWRALFKRN